MEEEKTKKLPKFPEMKVLLSLPYVFFVLFKSQPECKTIFCGNFLHFSNVCGLWQRKANVQRLHVLFRVTVQIDRLNIEYLEIYDRCCFLGITER